MTPTTLQRLRKIFKKERCVCALAPCDDLNEEISSLKENLKQLGLYVKRLMERFTMDDEKSAWKVKILRMIGKDLKVCQGRG